MLKSETLYAVETLVELGVLSEDGLLRLAELFRGLKAFTALGAFTPAQAAPKPRKPTPRAPKNGSELSFGHDPDSPQERELKELLADESEALGNGRKRAPKGSFNLSREELEGLRRDHTVKEIAELRGVSAATVNKRLRDLGLTDGSKRGRPRKS